jgi:hypothetical protein
MSQNDFMVIKLTGGPVHESHLYCKAHGPLVGKDDTSPYIMSLNEKGVFSHFCSFIFFSGDSNHQPMDWPGIWTTKPNTGYHELNTTEPHQPKDELGVWGNPNLTGYENFVTEPV